MEQGILLFSGYNPRAIVAFLRTLKSAGIQNYAIIARDKQDFLFRTAYCSDIVYSRQNKSLELSEFQSIANLLRQTYGWKTFMIVPSTEYLNRWLLWNRSALTRMGYRIPLVSETLYESISDKEQFSLLCSKNGFCVPAETAFPNRYERPFIAKPKRYIYEKTGSIYSPVLIRRESDYEDFCKQMPVQAFYYQEFICGESFYLLFYFAMDGTVYKLSQRNLMQQPNGKSILAARIANLHTSPIANRFISLFQALGFFGLVMVELRKREDTYYMIEANPRLWGPSQLFVDANYNFFTFFLKDHGFLSEYPSKPFNGNARYFWHGGLQKVLDGNEKPVLFDGFMDISPNTLEQWKNIDIYRREDTMNLWRGGV